MKDLGVNGVQYRIQSVPVYYGIIVVMRCGESGGEKSGENECLFDEQHGRRRGDVDGDERIAKVVSTSE